jgi:drug/metabolite transporter (DMT)-like permease
MRGAEATATAARTAPVTLPAPSEPEIRAILWALAAAAGFGAGMVTTRLGLRRLSAAAGARISIPTAALMLWLLAPWRVTVPVPVPWEAVAIFAAVGLAFPAWVTLLTFEANRRLGATNTAMLSATAPVFAVLGGVLLLGEPLTGAVAGGTAAVVAGAALFGESGPGRSGGRARWALLLPLLASLIRAGAQVGTKAGLALLPQPFLAALIAYTVSAASALLWGRHAGPLAPGRMGAAPAAWFAVTGLCNGAAVVSLYTALGEGAVSRVAPVAAAAPLVTFALSAAVFPDERFTLRRLAAVTLVAGGVAWVAAA